MQYKRLKELRTKYGYTQEKVAKYLHVDQKTYSRYELGQHEMTPDTLGKLATLYDTSVDYLIERTDNIKSFIIHNQPCNHDYLIPISQLANL